MTTTAERQSREVAEAAREREWKGASFLRDLFLGRFRLDLVHPYPVEEPDRRSSRRRQVLVHVRGARRHSSR